MSADSDEAPVWQRPDAFPPAPAGHGWIDAKGRRHACVSREDLLAAIREDRDAAIVLVWSPESPRVVIPEELQSATADLIAGRRRRAWDDLEDARDKLKWFGFMLGALGLYLFYQGWSRGPMDLESWERIWFGIRVVAGAVSMGITLLMFLIFAFIPYYQARKRIAELEHWNRGELNEAVPILRFETWLDLQKSPATRWMMALMLLVGIFQLAPGSSLEAAGLYKDRFFAGEWWRLFTAPFLHANLIHFLMNLSALLYLGKRMEVFARWPHVPLVFLLSCLVAGEASARFVVAPSVGASGGLMGWLGFLLVFESTHVNLVPRSCRRRLLAGLALTVAIGLVGYRYIDNAAHLGGLVCGMFYSLILFPKSSTPHRPKSDWVDLVVGSLAMAACTIAAAWTVWLIR